MKRKNKTSLLKTILQVSPVLFGVFVVVYLALLIKDIELPTMLPVNDVHIIAELKFLDNEKIKATVKNNISGGYFTIDLIKMREILLQEPWVKNVSLRRKWPASLNVFIEEQVPVAYWNGDFYLSEKGDVFKPALVDKTLALPSLNGPEGLHNNVWKFMNVLYKETALLNYEVVRLDLDERRAWQMIIVGNNSEKKTKIDVRLGRFDTEKRLQRFVRVLPALTGPALTGNNGVAENELKVIDMRYPNGFAVRMATLKINFGARSNDKKV